MNDDLAAAVVRRWERLEADRSTFKTHWQDVANYVLPDRADYLINRSPGMKRMSKVYDATPVWALQQFASGLHGYLTSPTLPWFAMRCEDDKLDQDPDVRRWLDAVSARLYNLFNSPRHNFATQSHELYQDLGSIGTACMAVLDSPRSGVLFSTRHMRECVIAENDEDRIDTVIRQWKYTARQAYAAWGEAAGEAVCKAIADDRPDQMFTFLHAVEPRNERNPARADAKHKPFRSVYVSLSDKHVISEGGFDEFPYLVPRFTKSPTETYGRSPAMLALPDIKMLNEMVKTILKAAQKVVDPPLQVPDDGFMTGIKTTPGGLNFYKSGSQDRIEPIKTNGDVRLGIEMVNAYRQAVIRSMYVEWMLMPSDMSDPASAGKGVTATYTLHDRDQKMQLLSPVLARMQSEMLGPLIDRTFALEFRRSKAMRFGQGSPFPAPPQALAGQPVTVEYVSPIAIAQRASAMDGLTRLIQIQGMLQQVDPNALRILDSEAIMRLAGRDLNTPALALKSPDQLAQEKQAAAEAQATMNNHMALSNVADAAQSGASAVKNLAQAGAIAQQPPANATAPEAQAA